MSTTGYRSVALAVALSAILPCSQGAAQNVRTYVSETGGGPPGIFTTPCGTIQQAHDNTDAGGEVLCLDAGPAATVSAVTITKSITIDCRGSSRDVIVNAAGITVTLRNLTLNSLGRPAETGIGIDFRNG